MRRLVFIALVCGLPLPAQADGLPLPHSQQSYASACLAFDDSADRIAVFCETALSEPGLTQAQRLRILRNLGDAHLTLDQEDQARATFEAILEIASDDVHAHAGLGWAAYNMGDYARAEGHFATALEVFGSAQAMAGLAASQFRSGAVDLDTTLTQLDRALTMNPQYTWAAREMGWLLINAERYEEAERAFGEALAVAPEDVNALLGLATSLRHQDELAGALTALMEGVTQDPSETRLYAERSHVYWLMDWNKLALRDADRVIADWPDLSDGYVYRARALYDLGRGEDALQTFETAQPVIGFSSWLFYHHALYLSFETRWTEAADLLRRIVAEGSADAFDLLLLSKMEFELGDFLAATGAIDQALELRPALAEAHFVRAKIHAVAGEADAAMARFDQALDLGLDFNDAPQLGQLLVEAGAQDAAGILRQRFLAWKRSQF